jgi:NAD(P)H-dependent flavin oxidoreductase YrpB (nitropropane dioxygenase family)
MDKPDFCQSYGIEVPVVLAGMAMISEPELDAAASEGLGARRSPLSGFRLMTGAGWCTATNGRSGMARRMWYWSRCQLAS